MTSKQDLVDSINAYLFGSAINKNIHKDTLLCDIGVTPNVSLAQTLSDCKVLNRPPDESEQEELASLANCDTFGDLLAWCNNEKPT